MCFIIIRNCGQQGLLLVDLGAIAGFDRDATLGGVNDGLIGVVVNWVVVIIGALLVVTAAA